MNVVSKSTNFAPFLKAATIAISNGLRPVAGTGKVQRAKISALPFIQRATSQSLSESLISGPLCVRSGIAVSSQAIQRRHAHTDIQWPDYDHYRRNEVKDPHINAKESAESRRNFAYLVVATSGVAGVYGAKTVVTQFVSMLSASADVMALAKIEVKLDAIPPGMSAVFKWRGKPLFVRHRTAKEIQKEESVDISTLRDPELDSARVQKPEWLIVLGVCTHLGCVPIANAGDYGGYYCPCHGSHYDASGRIRRGPAPANLEVPAYQFIEDNVILVG